MQEPKTLARSRSPVAWIAAVSYLAMVLALWIPFNLRSGLPSETGFVYTSEISTWWNGFLYGANHLRVHTSTFFQVPYLLGELCGFRGSFVPYQIVYAALWWSRSFLMFLIVRWFLPGHEFLCYLAGAFTLIHSSDRAAQWAGQMPQHAYIFWMLLAFYFLMRAFDATGHAKISLFLALSALFEHLSLWSYESQIFIIFAAPLLLLRGQAFRTWKTRVIIWYLLPIIYLCHAALTYARSGGHTYQESVLRNGWQPTSILSDWLFNISASLKFWSWPGSSQPKDSEALLAWLAVIAFLAGMAILFRSQPDLDRRLVTAAMGTGAFLLVFSFPVYLILDSARSLWRTQILSGLGAALIFAAAISLCGSYARRSWLRFAIIATVACMLVWYGSFSALKKGALQHSIWETHRSAMAKVISAAPQLKPGTLVILMNAPKQADPCSGNNMWFDIAIRLAYPSTAVAGACYYEGGVPAPGNTLQAIDGRWRIEGNTLVHEVNASEIVVIDDAEGAIAKGLPDFLHANEDAARTYNPAARIAGTTPSERATRRYGPLGN